MRAIIALAVLVGCAETEETTDNTTETTETTNTEAETTTTTDNNTGNNTNEGPMPTTPAKTTTPSGESAVSSD